MLSSVKITNPRGNELELPMNEGAEIVIKGISGLGPVKADILTAEYVNVPGGAYKGNKQNQRNIVMLLGFQPTHESEDPYGELRRGLYPWFITGARVEMVFESTGNWTANGVDVGVRLGVRVAVAVLVIVCVGVVVAVGVAVATPILDT